MVEYEIEDPNTHETHTGETFTLYDQPISSNGKFKVVKWNNIPDNPFYDGLLGEGLVLRKITETEQTTDRDWDIHINVQPNLYALNLGTISTNTNGVITRTPQEFGYDYYGFSSVSYEIDIKNGELNIGTIRANTNNTEITLLPSSYNWQYFNKVKYIVDVPQGITTNLFNTIRSNNTYSLSQLYTGNDNPVAFKPDSQINVQVDPPVLSVGPLNLGSLTDNTTQTVTIDPSDYHYDYFNQVSYSVNVPKPITTTFNTIIANSTQNYTLSDLYLGQDNPIGFKPDSIIPVLVDHHLISNDTFTITSNNQTYTVEQLMQLNQYLPSSYNGLSKTCSIRVQVPETLVELEPNQVISLTQNRKRKKYNIYDYEKDDDLDIRYDSDVVTQSRGVTLTRDVIDDPTYRNIGSFEIDTDIPIEQNKTINITSNGTQNVLPVSGFEGLEDITINVNVPQTLVNNYTQPTITTNGTYTIPSGYTGFNNFSVNVPTPPIKISRYFKIVDENTSTYSSYFQLTKYSQTTTHNLYRGYGYVFITEGVDYMSINYRNSVQTASTITLNNLHWFAQITSYNNLAALILYKYNNTNTPNERFLGLRDVYDSLTSYTTIYNTNMTII